MKRQMFEVASFMGDREFEEVTGYPVVVPGFEQLSLFVHRSPNSPGKWNVSEVETGRAVSLNNRSRKSAIADAQVTCEKRGLDWFISTIANTRKISEMKAELVGKVMGRMINA